MKEQTYDEFTKMMENQEINFTLYLYTPLCGTCQVAGRILSVTEELFPSLQMFKTDLNYSPKLAEDYQVESVPCLLLFQNGELKEKIYAFHSVPYLYEKLNSLYNKG